MEVKWLGETSSITFVSAWGGLVSPRRLTRMFGLDCRRDQQGRNFSRNGMLQQHKTCKKRPQLTHFIPIKADKFKSAQTYKYPSYHRVFDETTNMLSNVATCCQMSCRLDTLADMQCRRVADMTEDVSATCRDTTQHVCK
jgi:hypothetical protein